MAIAKTANVHDFFEGKTILVTGATGFLGKVIGKDVFRVLRYRWGTDFDSFISKKVVAVAGDVSLENLGIKDENTRRLMFEELDIIVHAAATTNFNERYDLAMNINTMGAFHVVNFAKNCRKLEIIPVDMVVSFMIVASMAHSRGLSQNLVYYIGSSMINPFKITDLVDFMYYYFTKNPCVDKDGKPIVVTKKITALSTRVNELNENKSSVVREGRLWFVHAPLRWFVGIVVGSCAFLHYLNGSPLLYYLSSIKRHCSSFTGFTSLLLIKHLCRSVTDEWVFR
ncbi:hypothetical protein Fmac_020512 [Flemingia macrophylla]|uniref:Fatty acyl-CoA reductase n=1 Tax=Flemingia macrophylla TaxID=520843 RepID=A0ABD1LUA2_9FABA